MIDAAGLGDGGVGVGLERHLAAAAHALVRGDDHVGFAVGDAPGERVGREAAEHHGMDGADARAGEHGVDRLGDHRQIDGDAVALLDVAVAQDVGEPADLVVQLAVGDVFGLGGVVALPDDRGLVGALGEMAIDAVVGGVEDAVLEPFDRDVAGRERAVLDLARGLVPVEALGLLGPESVRILERARVHLLVLGGVDIGALLPLRRNVVDLFRHHRPPGAAAENTARNCSSPGRRFRTAMLSGAIMRRRPHERQDGEPSTLVAAMRARAAKCRGARVKEDEPCRA